MDHDYSISDGRNDIVVLHKAWISWGDCYEIDIADGIDELLVLAVVIAIDFIIGNAPQKLNSRLITFALCITLKRFLSLQT